MADKPGPSLSSLPDDAVFFTVDRLAELLAAQCCGDASLHRHIAEDIIRRERERYGRAA